MTDIARDPRVAAAIAAHPFPLAFATISGAHLYGFSSPDSDVDIRGSHVLPVKDVIGLDPGPETVTRSEMRDGLEVDLVTHDIRKFATLLLKRNGYVLEQLLSPLVVVSTPMFDELRALSGRCITRNHGHHYLGFATTQWDLFEREEPRRVKPLLYVYRVLLTGIHLLRTGEIEANLRHLLAGRSDLPEVAGLVDAKRAGSEGLTLAGPDLELHRLRYQALRNEVEAAMERSTLPDHPSARRDLDDLIIRARVEGVQATGTLS